MIRITIDLVSARGREHDQRLGMITIGNDGDHPQHPSRGNYTARFFGKRNQPLTKGASIKDWPRKGRSVLSLLKEVLKQAGY